jgi:hypothetical protein
MSPKEPIRPRARRNRSSGVDREDRSKPRAEGTDRNQEPEEIEVASQIADGIGVKSMMRRVRELKWIKERQWSDGMRLGRAELRARGERDE